MKIGIVTCHDVYNYGASLQAYALSQYLINAGMNAEIINYVPPYLYRIINLLEVDAPKWKSSIFSRWVYRVYTLPLKLSWMGRYVAFKRFNLTYLPLSQKCKIKEYSSINAMGYDSLICGSDQIWNSSRYKCGEDPFFFLEFGGSNIRKVAYAASFGDSSVSLEAEKNIKQYLPGFKAISVREKSSVELLSNYGLHVECVLDPVFLLEAEQWRQIKKKPRRLPSKYIFVYGYDNSAELEEAILTAKKELDIPEVMSTDPVFKRTGPLEFLGIIDDAELVITTSFHAIAFSIILHTPFVTAMTGNAGLYERIENILSISDLQNRRFNRMKDEGKKLNESIDFARVDMLVDSARTKSEAFLKRWVLDNEVGK